MPAVPASRYGTCSAATRHSARPSSRSPAVSPRRAAGPRQACRSAARRPSSASGSASDAPTPGCLIDHRAVIRHRVPAERCRFSYFLTRCYAEGLSKAQVSDAVGAEQGMAAERRHAAVALPKGVARGLADGLRGDLGAPDGPAPSSPASASPRSDTRSGGSGPLAAGHARSGPGRPRSGSPVTVRSERHAVDRVPPSAATAPSRGQRVPILMYHEITAEPCCPGTSQSGQRPSRGSSATSRAAVSARSAPRISRGCSAPAARCPSGRSC